MVAANEEAMADPGTDVQISYDRTKVRRHFTISSTMLPHFYNMVIQACNAYFRNEDYHKIVNSQDWDDLWYKRTDQVIMTIKNQGVPQGLSRQFFDPKFQKQAYEIKGPMGKGLGVNNQSKGLHIVFTTGTGTLVFIDLVVRMILSNLGVIREEERMHPEFKLHLYVSFFNRQESVALDLLEALQKIQW